MPQQEFWIERALSHRMRRIDDAELTTRHSRVRRRRMHAALLDGTLVESNEGPKSHLLEFGPT
jgi:hypothetical protein